MGVSVWGVAQNQQQQWHQHLHSKWLEEGGGGEGGGAVLVIAVHGSAAMLHNHHCDATGRSPTRGPAKGSHSPVSGSRHCLSHIFVLLIRRTKDVAAAAAERWGEVMWRGGWGRGRW